jgi:hypothetical protein
MAQLGAIALIASTLGMLAPAAANAAVARKAQDPTTWTEHFCTELVGWQVSALDARDAAFPIARTVPPDRAGVKVAARQLDGALKPPTKALDDLATSLGRRTPKGRRGAEVGAEVAAGVAELAAAYGAARERAQSLGKVQPSRFANQAPRVLARLDTDLERAAKSLSKLERRVDRSSVGNLILASTACRRLGLEWSTTGGPIDTPPPTAVDPTTPGADDVTAPAVLLPGRYRPTPEIAAIAARTTMTGLGRTYFYSTSPEVITGQAFATSCPTTEPTQQILGCFHDDRIFVLKVTRPDLATVVDVTAAHELLHAIYEDLSTVERGELDPQLSAMYDSTPDVHIHQVIPVYQRRAPQHVSSELHSFLGTQIGTLTPPLDEHYGQYFEDRSQIVAAFVAYISVVDNLLDRYHALDVQLTELRDQIDGVRSQATAAGAEADRLGAQIDALRAQGRIAESNALVPSQNDAVRRANSLSGQMNGLVDRFNALVDEIRAVVAELGGVDSALRPI